MGATPMPGNGEPPLRGWAATGGWRGPSVLLVLLLLLCPLPAPACPHTCHCQAGDVDCHQRDLHEVPRLLPTNASTLWLDYNLIAVLRAHAFPSLPVLLRLSLTHNRLEKIHRQALLGLGTLQELDLSDNYLSVLSPETFLPLTSLSILNLGYNRLEQLEAGVLPALPQLQVIFLNGNPWMCSCSILPLWRWLEHNREKVPGECPRECVPTPPPAPPSLGSPISCQALGAGAGVPARFPKASPIWVDLSSDLVPRGHSLVTSRDCPEWWGWHPVLSHCLPATGRARMGNVHLWGGRHT